MNPLPIEPAEVRQVGNKTIYLYRPQQIYKHTFKKLLSSCDVHYKNNHSTLAHKPTNSGHMKSRYYTGAV